MNTPFNMIIAGGKTGGHLFPGIAVAQAVQRLHNETRLLFVGTNAVFETDTLNKYGYAHKAIFSKPVKGGSLLKKIGSMGLILISLVQSLYILKTFKPDFVLGVGGFSSFAVVLAAWIMRIPRGIAEQNAMPGLTNRMLARFTDIIFTSFEQTKGFSQNPKVRLTGNPVRTAPQDKNKIPEGLTACTPGRTTILVTGGSQGASSINRAFTDALKLMDDPGQYNIIHQTGRADESKIRQIYRQLGIKADIGAFFHDMPQIQAMADLVIARAGAGTLFELSAAGVASILVPFPHAADDHQTHNARTIEDQGAAVMIKDADLNGQTLFSAMQNLISDPDKRQAMADRFKTLARPDADTKIAAHILNTKGIKVNS